MFMKLVMSLLWIHFLPLIYWITSTLFPFTLSSVSLSFLCVTLHHCYVIDAGLKFNPIKDHLIQSSLKQWIKHVWIHIFVSLSQCVLWESSNQTRPFHCSCSCLAGVLFEVPWHCKPVSNTEAGYRQLCITSFFPALRSVVILSRL